ncbi:hypothetical protein NEF87_002090 [Candidatus Lokiarchaeum ossiferum]|uniref:Leucine-rich repeat domain-containing protein n=1 Tax=Candidatus Lokiarchaeum ossiferum TaxID=2951803 RepID=A0ABY6HQM7_9ARCH|nr:hypothetical protein NEF87_002090 [Candidatus Lokiarchaeum sp. B-35]
MPKGIDPNKYFYARTLLSQKLSIAEVRKELKKIFGTSISPNKLIEIKAEIETSTPPQAPLKHNTGISRIFRGKSDTNDQIASQTEMFNAIVAKLDAKIDQQAILIHQLFDKFEKYGKTFAYWEKRFAHVDFVEHIHDGPEGVSDLEFLEHRKATITDFLRANPKMVQETIDSETIEIIATTTSIDSQIVRLVLQEMYGSDKIEDLEGITEVQRLILEYNAKIAQLESTMDTSNSILLNGKSPLRPSIPPQTAISSSEISKIGSKSVLPHIQIENQEFTQKEKKTANSNQVTLFGMSYQISEERGIKKLDLSNTGLTTLQEIIGLKHIKDLQILDLSENNLKAINFADPLFHDFQFLGSIQHLILRFNQITSIQGLERLPNLEVLYISHNQLTSLQDSGIQQLKQLYVLDLSNNEIDMVEGIAGIENLTQLDLSYNHIQSWSGIEHFLSLTTLNLAHNEFLDMQGSGLQNLKSLDMTHNQIDTLAGLEHFQEIEYLILAENNMLQIDRTSGQIFTSIIGLDLSKNNLQDLLGLEQFPAVEDLNIADNQIESCVGIEVLPALNKVNLAGNLLTFLNGLQDLGDVQQQLIRSSETNSISGLQELILSRNQIMEITELEKFSMLAKIDLQENEITSIQGLGKLMNLDELYLEGNPVYDWVVEENGEDPSIIAKWAVNYCIRMRY